MKPASWRPLARGVVLESLRRKDLWVVAILALVILFAASALGIFGAQGLQVFVKDLAAAVLGLFSTLLAVMVSTRLLPEEIKNRTLYPLLARPIGRFDLLMGKFLGAVLVSWLGFLILCAATCVALLFFRADFEPIMFQYVLGKMMGIAVVCAIGVAFSTFMTPAASATVTALLALGSMALSRALYLAGAGQPSLQWLFEILNGAVPQLHLFDLGGRAVYSGWSPVPFWVMAALFVYAGVYSAAMLGLAWLKFRKQAI